MQKIEQQNTHGILSKYKEEKRLAPIEIGEIKEDQVEEYEQILEKAKLAEENNDYITAQRYLEQYQYYVQKKDIIPHYEIQSIITDNDDFERGEYKEVLKFLLSNIEYLSKIKYIFSTLGFENEYELNCKKSKSESLNEFIFVITAKAVDKQGVLIIYEYNSSVKKFRIIIFVQGKVIRDYDIKCLEENNDGWIGNLEKLTELLDPTYREIIDRKVEKMYSKLHGTK